MSSFYIFLNSKDRVYGSSSNFCINFTDYDLQAGSNLGLSLESANIPNLCYPVKNFSLVFYENGVATPIQATIDDGVYSGDEFATALQTALNSVGGNVYTVVFNSNTYKLTIETTLPNTIQLILGSSNNDGVDINRVLGFDTGNTSAGTALTSTYPINLSGTSYVDVEFEGIDNNNIISSFNSNGIIARIDMSVPFGYIQYYQSQESDDYSVIDGRYLNRIRIRILDEDGDLFDIPDTFEVSLVLRVQNLN